MTKILLVEDDKSLREIYGVRLLAEGYDIVSAGDGEEALAMAIKERPDLIVSDVMMPKISGFDMLDILRSTTETKDIKVIMMTALSSEDQRQRGEQLGADRYLVKSQVGIEDVVRTVHDVLQDIPTAAPTPQQAFGTPAPSAVSRPAPTPAPRPAAPAPTIPQPQTAPTQSPQATPVAPAPTPPQPVVPIPPTPQPAPAPTVAPTPSAQPQPSDEEPLLPQPTAPFSTQRPANLGDRIIQPLSESSSQEDIARLIERELSAEANTPSADAPRPEGAPTNHIPVMQQEEAPAPVEPQQPTTPTPEPPVHAPTEPVATPPEPRQQHAPQLQQQPQQTYTAPTEEQQSTV